ncbi:MULTISPECIES: dihydroneopterin aldolase [Alphaproteobacteria]|uniref:7,8-dihydroneopterin aldolase n=2 Tax=Alphaproteobacteria TaxID=28211 RepID=A0A512HCH3_9HYPH|nr:MULTISPECIES: dihydroneopterin aldolase [Alphaproteobacteria]GEO83151.1 7,8-dihydroneopterin aldolase [Ciceribacter naphthalenivorans]GLR20454.1 7,8-dihydroneopterin aldolase [Ciceribacter naphthalenivorans]GLT03310.1 7,8-dihydroneopterin aldolase [Sphingomonas psychrolutea]
MTEVYTITLKNCAFFARHGVYPEEEFLGQRFFIDAEFDVLAGDTLDNDDLDGTVDYGIAFKVIEDVVTNSRRLLIEALALAIARELCQRFAQIRRAKITVRKPSAPVPGILDYVQVSVEHFN